MNRRRLLAAAGGAGVLAALGGGAGYALLGRDRPLALVYRGPASCSGCSEAVAALLSKMPAGYQVRYCGPGEHLPLSAETLAGAVVYAQPGGGEVRQAWRRLRNAADDVRAFVSRGGSYLGFCLGAYLAGSGEGFGLLDRVTVEGYIYTKGASVRDTDDTVVGVRWRDRPRHMFFQDGATFSLQAGAPATVLATYETGAPAAIVATYGAGRVGLTGPHPEADRSWYADAGLTNPDGIRFDLGQDLIESTMRA
ncbi:BPL-N domain-containing protein [Dactylosporangium sucinum]|uniref:BPL-N domain-containing protein n=1 Tax=Dactylosporangium sucinum TaxID=1424081 RepID=UPI001E384E65|nr:BPL-N domain-containing protein [Dactylosporangium sucinum]